MSKKETETPPRERNKVDLKEKLRAKIQQKKLGRMNNIQRKHEIDGYVKKMGLSEGDMKTITELSEKLIKQKQK